MKKWVALIFLVATAFSQQTNQDFWPASPGLNLGKSNQRWNGNFNNVNITGTCTINGASCLGAGSVTGATTNGGLVLTGHTLGMLKTCSTGQILSWNGTAWVCTSAGSGLPAGSDTQIQVNSVGGFGASPNFTFNLGTSTLSLSGTANISGPLTVTGALTNSALGPGGPFCVQENNGVFSSTGVACGSGGGSIGPGTTNKLTYWTSSSTVGSSDITQTTGVVLTTSDRVQINGNYFQSLFTAPNAGACNISSGILSNPGCFGITATGQLGASSASTNGIISGVFGSGSSGSTSVTGNPYVVGVYGLGNATGTGVHAWIAGIVGQSNTSNIGTVAVSSGVVAIGATGSQGAGGGSATLLNGVDAQVQIQNVSETSARTAGVYIRSPVLTGASTQNVGLLIEDQTVGGGNNTDPYGILENGSAKNKLGGSLTLAGIVGSTQCLHVNSVGLISGTGADCGSGGGGTFPSGTGFAFVNASSSWASAVASTGTGNVVLSSNAVLVTPNLGTPSAIVLTNATGFPTLNQNTTGTSGGLTGCTQAAAGDVCYWNGAAWTVFTGNNSGTAVFQENASGVPSWGAGVAATYQVNGVALSSASTINFQNSAATNGITLTFTNSSAGIVKLGYTGTLTNAGLTNSATTVNGQTCTLGSTCTIPEQVNTVNMTSQAGFNLLTSTANSVGLTVTPVNSATNALKFEVTGGSYTGNAAGLFGTPSITVNGITATTYNGGTMSGTFPGNPTFSGAPVFSTMGAGGPFCVQETAGVLSTTGVACGSGGGGSVGPGTVNGLAYFNASSTIASIASTIEGQVVVFHHIGPPTAVSPSLTDNGSGPVNTTPYTVQCDSATTLLDRGSTIRFTTGASVVTIPDSTGSGCSGLATILQPITVSLTLNASGSDTFTVIGNGPAQTGLTTITLTDGQFASINQAAPTIWEIRVTQGGSVTSVATGAGLTGGPITTTGTLSIATGGVTSTMLAGSIAITKMNTQPQNTVWGSFTSNVVQALPMASCSGNNQVTNYTSNVGFGCVTGNFLVGQLGIPSTWTADQDFRGHLGVNTHDLSKVATCPDTSGSGTAQVCNTTPTFTPAAGDYILYTTTSANSGAGLTINVNSLGAKSVAKWQTSTTLAANDVRANTYILMKYDGTNWEMDSIGNGPSGSGTVTVVSAGNLTSGRAVLGGGSQTLQTGTATLDTSGNAGFVGLTASGAVTLSVAGAASTPALTLSGAAFSGGTATTNFPQLYLNCTGATAVTSFSANGTQIGANPCTGWAGNYIDFHINGSANSRFVVDSTGSVIMGTGTTSISSLATGTPALTFATNSISSNQPISIVQATNQIVTGTSTNLTTSNYPASSGAVTLTFPKVTTNILGGNSDTTTTDVLHATATGGIGSFSPLVVADLPTAIPIGNVGSAGLSATSPIAIASTGVISISADPTFNSLTCGTLNTTACIITGYGSTSGTATLTWPAVAGTTTNAITSSNRISAPAFTSTVSTGTAPFVVSSTTVVTNLNASTVGGFNLGTPVAGGIGYGVSTTQVGTTSAGTVKQLVLSGGTGAPTFITFPDTKYAPAANCVNTIAGSGWSTGATPAALCRAGTNNKSGLLSPWGASDVGYIQFHIAADADLATTLPNLMLEVTTTESSTHTIIMQESVGCAAEDGSTTDDVAFNAARSFTTVTETTRANQVFKTSITLNSTDLTGCTAPGIMWVKISRTTDTATNVGVYGLNLTQYRLLTAQAN